MTAYEMPRPVNWSKDSVESFAAEARTVMGHGGGPAANSLKSDLRELGGKISYVYDTNLLKAESHKEFEISLSPNTTVDHDNFTLARALGHLAMHLSERPLSVPRGGVEDDHFRRAAWEADCFASEFLMPRDEFPDVWRRLGGDLAFVAVHYGVIRSRVFQRAQSLGLYSIAEGRS